MKKRIFMLTAFAILIILLVIGYCLLFFKTGIAIPCLFHKITGLYCPGCGISRMFLSLFKLDFYQAFRFNPLVFIALPFIIVFLIDYILKWLKGKDNYLYVKINDKVWIFLVIITLLFGVARNIPFFDYLIPTMI